MYNSITLNKNPLFWYGDPRCSLPLRAVLRPMGHCLHGLAVIHGIWVGFFPRFVKCWGYHGISHEYIMISLCFRHYIHPRNWTNKNWHVEPTTPTNMVMLTHKNGSWGFRTNKHLAWTNKKNGFSQQQMKDLTKKKWWISRRNMMKHVDVTWCNPIFLHLSHYENLQSLPMSYHFGYAKASAMLTRVDFFLTRSKLRKPLREVLTRPYASEGFAYAKPVMTRPLLKM